MLILSLRLPRLKRVFYTQKTQVIHRFGSGILLLPTSSNPLTLK